MERICDYCGKKIPEGKVVCDCVYDRHADEKKNKKRKKYIIVGIIIIVLIFLFRSCSFQYLIGKSTAPAVFKSYVQKDGTIDYYIYLCTTRISGYEKLGYLDTVLKSVEAVFGYDGDVKVNKTTETSDSVVYMVNIYSKTANSIISTCSFVINKKNGNIRYNKGNWYDWNEVLNLAGIRR